MADGDVTLHPQWKQAVQDFLAAGFKPGDVITHEWLSAHFGVPFFDGDTKVSAAEYRDRQFEWLANIELFKTELLMQHQIFLRSVFGEGYRWVPPGEQTGAAMKEFEQDARRAARKAGMRVANVRYEELTDEQRQENVNALARISFLEGMRRNKQLK